MWIRDWNLSTQKCMLFTTLAFLGPGLTVPNSARIEKQISDIQGKQERKKMEIIQAQTQLQQDAQAQVGA